MKGSGTKRTPPEYGKMPDINPEEILYARTSGQPKTARGPEISGKEQVHKGQVHRAPSRYVKKGMAGAG